MALLLEYRAELARRLGGFLRGTVSLGPDATDSLAQRSILSSELYDADNNSKVFENRFAWVGKYRDNRRCRTGGYRTLSYAAFVPPTSGTYSMTFYGYGVVSSIPFDTTASELQDLIVGEVSSLASIIVSEDEDGVFVLSLPDVIDVYITAGTVLAQGNIGAAEVNRAFTQPLALGDSFDLLTKLPAEDADGLQGMHTFINMALARTQIIDRFPVTPGTTSSGSKTFYGLSDNPWLRESGQIIAVYGSTQWVYTATYTPPVSGSAVLMLDMGEQNYMTSSLAYTATASDIQAALQTAAPTLATSIAVTGSGPFTITLTGTRYAEPTLTATAGTITEQTRTMMTSPARAMSTWNFQYDAEQPFLDNYYGTPGESFLIEAYRPANTWIAPQESYGTPSTLWQSSTTGLQDDYDQAIPTVEELTPIAYWLCAQHLALVGPTVETTFWKQEALRAGVTAAGVTIFGGPRDGNPRGGSRGPGSRGWGSKGFWGR